MRQRLQKAMLVMVLCLLAVTTALAQAIQVKGIVYDGNGETMPGVNVHVKGAASGTITDVMVIILFLFQIPILYWYSLYWIYNAGNKSR